MSELWKIIAGIIASLGGGGAIVWALSSHLGKLWSERFMQKKKQEFEKELEAYKKDLSLEVEKYKTKADELTYISRIQFETEYEIYQKIFETLFDFSSASSNLFPYGLDQIPEDMKERKKEYIKRYKFYVESFNTFSRTLETNAPFIPKKIYNKFKEIRSAANEIACIYPEIRIQADERFAEDYAKIAHENYKKTGEFNEMISLIKDDVREYLLKLKVSEDE